MTPQPQPGDDASASPAAVTGRSGPWGLELSPKARTSVAIAGAVLAFGYWATALGVQSTEGNARVLFGAAMLFLGLMFFPSSYVWQMTGDWRPLGDMIRRNLILFGVLLLGVFTAMLGLFEAALATAVFAPIAAVGASVREKLLLPSTCARWGRLRSPGPRD